MLIAQNKKARHEYEIVDSIEAGIVLSGAEIKSLRKSGANLQESYVKVQNGECFLVGCHIAPYEFSRKEEMISTGGPTRERKLLLHKKEILRLGMQVQQKGLTILPIRLYINPRGRCKVELVLGRGKKLHDKRSDMRERDVKRQLARIQRNR